MYTSNVYLGGRYWTGLARTFILFPRTVQTVLLSSTLPSADGAPWSIAVGGQGTVIVECAVLYRLDPLKLSKLYSSYSTTYQSRITQALTSVANQMQTNSNLTVSDYYTNRVLVRATAYSLVQASLQAFDVIIVDFLLFGVTLPTTTDSTIVNTLVSTQQQVTAKATQAQINVNAETSYLTGIINQNVSLYVSQQTQLANVVVNTATASATAAVISASSTAYASFLSSLNFTRAQLLQYIYTTNLKNLPASSTYLANFETLSALVQT